jgi:CDP-paratose 2-epimerase
MKTLIIGGCGFIGYNVTEFLISKNFKNIFVADNLSGQSSKKNFLKLKNKKNIKFYKIDVSNFGKISKLIKKIKPENILALHGQVAVTKSIINPRKDFNNNFLSIFNLLESLRKYNLKSKLINLSSNKVYGKIKVLKFKESKLRYKSSLLIDEDFPLNFESPYSCSKGSADQYLLDYSKVFNINASSLRLSCVYGENQWGSEDQGWISWFIKSAIQNKTIRIFGNGKQVRDILHVSDLANLIYIMMKQKKFPKGEAFNIGGGRSNTISLLELVKKLETVFDKKINLTFFKTRFGDQKYFVNNLAKIKKKTGWRPKVKINKGLSQFIKWIESEAIK